jgi:hypothetical protein
VCGDFYDGERLMSDHEVLALLNAALTAQEQPAPAVTEEMLEAALAAYKNELLRYPTTHNSERDWMRAALAAAINGKEE